MKRNLTPVTITHRAPNLRSGRTEIWEAVSTDGVWGYRREEDSSTSWTVIHIPTDRWCSYTSLPKARAATASGAALSYLQDERN